MVIQAYAPTKNAEEAEVDRFYEDLQDLLELTPKKDVLFIIGDQNAKVGSQEIPEWSSGFPYFLQFKSEFGNKGVHDLSHSQLLVLFLLTV